MEANRYLTFALTKGRLADKTLKLLNQIGIHCDEADHVAHLEFWILLMRQPDRLRAGHQLVMEGLEAHLRLVGHLCGRAGVALQRSQGQHHAVGQRAGIDLVEVCT